MELGNRNGERKEKEMVGRGRKKEINRKKNEKVEKEVGGGKEKREKFMITH